MKKVYLDYASTTPLDPRVAKAMRPWVGKRFGNTMSLHSWGMEAKRVVEGARLEVAKLMGGDGNSANSGVSPNEIVFTSSATEANNLALKGVAFANQRPQRGGKGNKGHIIISAIEHHCVLNTAEWLRAQGFDVTVLPVDKYGLVEPETVEMALRDDTLIVSIMHANNEIGSIEPIKKIGRICKRHEVPFHTDAAQSFGKIPVDVNKMNVDLMTVSSHKMYGPAGAAALYVRQGNKLDPLLHGGGHEHGLRSSTLNVAAIVGFGEAVRISSKVMNKEAKIQTKLRDRLIKSVLKIENSHLNGHPTHRLPNNANFWFDFIEGESLVMRLDAAGIASSTGSACSSAELEPSHVLLAIGLRPEQAHGSLRLSLGRFTKREDIDYTLKILPGVVEELRKISPFKGKWK